MPQALMRMIKTTAFGIGGIFWLLMALGSLHIVWNSLTYIQYGTEHPFLIEKQPYSEGLFYLVMLWAHIAAGSVVLLAALGQLDGIWRPLARCASWVPRTIRDTVYDAVARVRHLLFQPPQQSCPVVPAELQSRFRP